MISFDCPSCGKHYTFSDKFAGRKLTCTGCKAENIVPEPEEELGLAPLSEQEPYHAPEPKEEVRSAAQPPEAVRLAPLPPPLPIGMTGVTGVPGIPEVIKLTGLADSGCNTVAPGSDAVEPFPDLSEADSTILAFVFEEKQKALAVPPIPPPLPQSVQMVEEPPKSTIVFWSIILSILVPGVVLGVYLGLFIDWRDPDPRIDQVKELEAQKIQAWNQGIAKESESRSLPHRSSESWHDTNKLLNDIVLIVDEIDDQQHYLNEVDDEKKTEIQEALSAAKTQLDELRKQAKDFSARAANSEVESVIAANDARLLKLESGFYALQEQTLRHDISNRPDARVPAELTLFDAATNRIPLDESFTLTSDWTENFFRRFDFPESHPDRFFAAFDYSRRLSGDKSLRVTSLVKQRITILFPEHRSAQADLSMAKFFNFSLQFPAATDPVSTMSDAGKISSMSVRFGNAAGIVEFLTTSPRYCDVLFFDGRGRFVAIEFPLTGNNFWRRTDNIDRTKLEGLGGGVEPTFFSRVDWVELCFFPLSGQTTFWIDAVFVSEQRMRPDYDLHRVHESQWEQRKREEELWKKREAELRRIR